MQIDSLAHLKKIGTEAFTASALVRMRFRLVSGVLFDTIIQVNLVSQTLQPASHTDSLNFSTVTIGSHRCLTIVLRNTADVGEAPFLLDSASFIHSDPSFSVASASWPAIINPQDSILIEVCFNPTDTLMHRDSLLIETECVDFPILVTGNGVVPEDIEEQKNHSAISIRPNPSQTELNIQFDLVNGSSIDIEITNILGETVYSQKHSIQSGSNNIKLFINGFPTGVYWVSVGGYRYKFIKN